MHVLLVTYIPVLTTAHGFLGLAQQFPNNLACTQQEFSRVMMAHLVAETANTSSTAFGHAPTTLVFLGTYTDYSRLPHWPYGSKEGKGLIVARWHGNEGRLEPLFTQECLNPAFMK